MGGSTKSISSTPNDIQGLRTSLVDWLMKGGQQPGGVPGGSPYTSGPNPPAPVPTSYGTQVSGSAQGGMSAQGMPNNGMNGSVPGAGGGGGGGAWQRMQSGNGGMAQEGNPVFAPGNMNAQGGGSSMYTRPVSDNMMNALGGGGGGGGASPGGMGGGTGAWERSRSSGYTPGQLDSAPGNPGAQAFGGPQSFATGSPNQAGIDWTNGGTRTPTPPGPNQPANPSFNQMFSQAPDGPVQAQHAQLPGMPGQINPNMIQPGSYGNVSGPTAMNVPQVNAQQIDPNAGNPMSSYMSVASQIQGMLPGMFSRGQVRDTSAQSSGYNNTQSVDQLGGAKSAFFNNMKDQLQPAFSQSRAEALAAAKEGMGNMGAGSAVANALGTAVNRSLGNEQATLADYASKGVQTEVGRQLQDAGQESQVGMANANRALSSDQGNQGADMGFLSQLLGQGNLSLGAAGQGLQAQMANQSTMANLGTTGANNALQALQSNQGAGLQASGQNAGNALNYWNSFNQMGQNAQNANMGAGLQAQLANQSAGNNAQGQNIANQMNQGQFNSNMTQNTNNLNAQLGQGYQQLVAQMGQQNAANFLNMLMGMSTTGVQGNQVVQSGGLGSLLAPIGQGVGAYLGAKAGK